MTPQVNDELLDAALDMMECVIEKMRARHAAATNPVLYFHYVQEAEGATPRRLHLEVILDIANIPGTN